MKKFISVLAIVLMAAIIFVGCHNNNVSPDIPPESEEKKITVTFDPDGGLMEKTSYSFETGNEFTGVEIPKKDKLFFIGWYDENGNEVNEVPEEDITLKAKWDTELDLGTHTTLFWLELYPEATLVIHVEKPEERETKWAGMGFTYGGDIKSWYNTNSVNETFKYKVSNLLELHKATHPESDIFCLNVWGTGYEEKSRFYLVYEDFDYTINFSTNGGNEMEPIGGYKNVENFPFLPPATKNGYEFVSWHIDEALLEPVTENGLRSRVDDNITVYARWIEEGAFENIWKLGQEEKKTIDIGLKKYAHYEEAIPNPGETLKFSVSGRQLAGYVELESFYIFIWAEDNGWHPISAFSNKITNVSQNEETGDFSLDVEVFINSDFNTTKIEDFYLKLEFGDKLTRGYPLMPLTVEYKGKDDGKNPDVKNYTRVTLPSQWAGPSVTIPEGAKTFTIKFLGWPRSFHFTNQCEIINENMEWGPAPYFVYSDPYCDYKNGITTITVDLEDTLAKLKENPNGTPEATRIASILIENTRPSENEFNIISVECDVEGAKLNAPTWGGTMEEISE